VESTNEKADPKEDEKESGEEVSTKGCPGCSEEGAKAGKPAVAAPAVRAGWRTTEFWMALAVVILGAFASSGILPTEHIIVKVAGLVIAVLGSLGYGISRGMSKKPPNTLFVLIGAMSVLSLSAYGCMGAAQIRTGLEGIHASTETASAMIGPYMHQKCSGVAAACASKDDKECLPLVSCQDTKKYLNSILLGSHHAVLMGMAALKTGDEAGASEWLSKASRLFDEASTFFNELRRE